jgi:hypothetical protein
MVLRRSRDVDAGRAEAVVAYCALEALRRNRVRAQPGQIVRAHAVVLLQVRHAFPV